MRALNQCMVSRTRLLDVKTSNAIRLEINVSDVEWRGAKVDKKSISAMSIL